MLPRLMCFNDRLNKALEASKDVTSKMKKVKAMKIARSSAFHRGFRKAVLFGI